MENSVVLPEGTEVSVEVAAAPNEQFDVAAPPVEEKIAAIFADVTAEEWSRLPPDLGANLDHYLYGTPK